MRYITARKAADNYGLHINSVYRIIRALEPPHVRREGRAVYVSTKYLNALYGAKDEPQPTEHLSEHSSEPSEHPSEQGKTVSVEVFDRVTGILEKQVDTISAQLDRQHQQIQQLSDQLARKTDLIEQLTVLNTRIALRMDTEQNYTEVQITEAEEVREETAPPGAGETDAQFTYTDWLRKSMKGEA